MNISHQEKVSRQKNNKLSLVRVTPSSHASTVDTVRIVAHGDLLYHLPILRGSEQFDGSYDFRRILPMSSPG
jgi:hypothetical protein